MKRNEMVEIIMNELAPHINYKTMPIIVASELLAKLEEEGMLPPSTEFLMGDTKITDNVWDME